MYTHIFLHVHMKCWSSDLEPPFIIWCGKISIAWAASLFLFINFKGFVTKFQGNAVVQALLSVSTAVGGWKNRSSRSAVQGEYLKNPTIFHDVELVLF